MREAKPLKGETEMRLELVKFEDLEKWAVLNSTMETMLPYTFDDHLHALLWLAFVNVEGLRSEPNMLALYHREILRWLDDVAPHYRSPAGTWPNGQRFPARTGDRIIPDAWAVALVDRSEWDEESLARPVELPVSDLEDLVESPKHWESAARYLVEQFGEWEPAKSVR